MENYRLKTPVGEANIPKNSHVHAALNHNVSTLVRASDLKAGDVFFRKECASDPFSDICSLVDDEELNFAAEMLYESRNGTAVPMPRRSLAKFLSSKNIFDMEDLEEMVWSKSDFSKREEREAIKYFQNQEVANNMRLSDSEVRRLLSMNPGSPAQWPWSKLRAYGMNDFSEELQRLARLYSRVEMTLETIKYGKYKDNVLNADGKEIDLSRAINLMNSIIPYGSYLRVCITEKSDSEFSDNKVLTLEQDGMPDSIKPLFTDFWQLAEDAYIMETIVSSLINTYLDNQKMKGLKLTYSSATKATMYKLLLSNAYTKEKYGDVEETRNFLVESTSRPIINDLNAGKIDEHFSLQRGDTANFANLFNYIMLYLPPDFLRARNEIVRFGFSRVRNPFLKEKNREENARRIRRLGRKFEEEFSMSPRKIRYFFSSLYLGMSSEKPNIRKEDVTSAYERANFGFISEQDFSAAIKRYNAKVPESLTKALFSYS